MLQMAKSVFKSFGTPQDITDISLAIAPDFVSVNCLRNQNFKTLLMIINYNLGFTLQ
jgi:hypothetical protein